MKKKQLTSQAQRAKAAIQEKMTPFSQQIETPLTGPLIAQLKSNLQKLKKILFQWSVKTGSYTYYNKKDSNIIKEYISHHHAYYQYDQFDSTFQRIPLDYANLDRVIDQSIIFKSFDLFTNCKWPIRFHSKFVSRINDYTLTQIFYVLGFVYHLSQGYIFTKSNKANVPWGYARALVVKTIPFNSFYVIKIFRQKNMLIHIGVEKIPIIKQGIIKRYQYINYMHFLDIVGDQEVQNKAKCDQRIRIFTDTIFNDVARKDHSQEIEVDEKVFSKKNHYLYSQVYNEYTERTQYYNITLSDEPGVNYLPLPIKLYYVSTAENTTMIFDDKIKRWLSKDHLNFMERKKIAQYQKQISDSLIKRFVDFQSAKTLVELLTKIPNFNVNLTEQEKDVIGENGNVLAIGRSGTGKTTCAVLRLFSIEMLFKIRVSLYQKKYHQTVKDVRCGANDIQDAMGLHCIFLTASPVLTHQIQRYYKKLTDNIKSELQKKKKKLQQQRKRKQQQQKLVNQEKMAKDVSFQDLNESQIKQQKSVQIIQKSIKQQNQHQNEEVIPKQLLKTESAKSVEELEEENEMNEQLKDIELNEDINNQNFDDKEEDIDELKHKFQQNIKKYHSLYDLEEKDYPGFFTVKSFIMMIDGVLPKPFFIRNKNQIVNQDSQSSWHNQRKGVMMIENYYKHEEQQSKLNIDQIQQQINYSDQEELEHQYLRQIQLKENKQKQQITKKLQKHNNSNKLSFQVDYNYFVVHFWPWVVKKYYCSRNITPHLVWTEIYSTIKGSATSHQYPGQYLTQNAYMNATTNSFLTRQQKLDIYETYCQYQRWKIRAGGYDIMDTVNYILNYIRFRPYEGPQIHYVMIDQVQDLPHAIVYLLSKIANYGVFYSGDTAQTIAKGVGFRFCDLKSLFNPQILDSSLQLKAPVIKHLTINFRSHNNILQLANSVVSSIEILFPKTIDRMKKQISDLHGPKPMILSSSDEELLFYVLCGGQQKAPEQNQNAIKKSPLEFGCDQVIIVRDQESKQRVPSMLQHALCLTIYEAKGLQFNDVILFNFFSESPCQQKWSLLKNLEIVTQEIEKEEYQKNLSRHKVQEEKMKEDIPKQTEKQQKQEIVEQQYQQVPVDQVFNKQTNTYRVKKLAQNKKTKVEKDINDYAELCSELKLLYTAITRPRKTLIIYDDVESQARSTLQRIWQRLDVIEIITKQLVLQSNKKAIQSEQVKIFKKIITTTTNEEWKQQGLKMYSRGYFDQALKCFERSGHTQLCKKAKANKFADQSTKKLIEVQSERNAIKSNFHTYKNMSNSDISKIKKKLKNTEAEAINYFKHAGFLFEEMLMFKQAGQCYFSGKVFEKAFECFCKAFMNKQAAESLQMQNKYRQAAQYYEKDGNYLKVIQCLDLVNEWTLILQKIHAFSHKMSDYQKQALLKKYSALALQELVYQIQFQNQEEEKKPQNNRVEVIAERESDQQEYDSDEDPQIAAQRQFQRKMSQSMSGSSPSRKQSQVEDPFVQIKDSIKQNSVSLLKPENQKESIDQPLKQQVSASFSDLNQSNVQIIKKEEVVPIVDASFSDLNDSLQAPKIQQIKQAESNVKNGDRSQDIISIDSSFNDVNAKFENELQPDLESIKSLVDPDDIWVKNSISQIGKKLHSQYSVIDDDQQNYNINVKIIKTKGNIFVQDQIMRKIVNIVSIINSSVQQFFTQFKGYQSLITLNKKQNSQTVLDDRPQIRQFQDIDPKFINIILDTLESFKLFKLCLFVCNRYHLPSKAGRYLLSLGLRYSTNCISVNLVNPILLAPSNFRKTQLQKGILASIALHAIYENVNADFLKIKINSKQQQNKHSLGLYFIQGLILQGLYKKSVFMLNPQQALKILENFNDFQVYNSLYNQKMLKRQGNHTDLIFLNHPPSSQNQTNYTRMLLKKVLFETSVVLKFQSISQRYYRQFGQVQPTANKLGQYKIPNYLPFTKILLEKRDNLIVNLKQEIYNVYDILKKGNSMQVLDVVGSLLIIIHSEEYQYTLMYQFDNDQFLQFYRCVKYIHLALKKFAGTNTINIIQAVFFMHQCYRIQYCKTMSYLNDIYCFVHRTSTVANQLVENSKTNAGQFAYFFQQDYNLILSKTSKVSKIITKKYELALSKLFTKRSNWKKYSFSVLAEQFIAQEEEQIIRKALNLQIQQLIGIKAQAKLNNVHQAKPKKTKQLKASYDFRHNSAKEYYSVDLNESCSEEEVDQYPNQQFKFYRPNFNTKLKYMAPLLIDAFLEHSKHAKEIIEGQQFYSAGLNSFYREYTDKKGGYNLFDAVQFKKFNRIDLYAQNILSIIDNLTLFAKHNFLAENLVLLMVQYRSLEQPKGFSLQVTSNQLKYFQKLQFDHLKGKPKEVDVHLNTLQIKNILNNQNQCIFRYNNKYVSEMNCSQIANLICDYLQILKDQQASQFVDFDTIILSYALNITSNQEITDIIRKTINLYAKDWKSELLIALSETKSVEQFIKKKKQVLSSIYKVKSQQLHIIEVNNVGDLKKAIENSEFDYQVQGRILKAKKKAASKIIKWWRAQRLASKQKKKEGNYLQQAVLPERLNHAKKVDTIKDIRLMQAIYSNKNILQELNFLLQTEEAKQQLISFLLTNIINSSLDFHFILMSLNKIQQCRQQYFEYCGWDPEQIHQFDIQETKEEMQEMLKTISIWKKDEKWLRDKNLNLKKKKVFEVKWMSKSYGLSGLLKKRAGLKKQEVLQKKKNLLKRMK